MICTPRSNSRVVRIISKQSNVWSGAPRLIPQRQYVDLSKFKCKRKKEEEDRVRQEVINLTQRSASIIYRRTCVFFGVVSFGVLSRHQIVFFVSQNLSLSLSKVVLSREYWLCWKARYSWTPHWGGLFLYTKVHNIFNLKSNWSKLVSTWKSTVLSLPFR